MADSSPQEVGKRFVKRIESLLSDYQRLLNNVDGQRRQASLETLLAEQTLMSLGIYWEAFLHELIIAYILQSPDTYIAEYKRKLTQNLTDKFPGAVGWTTISPPPHLTRTELEMLLDPQRRNFTISDYSKLPETVNKLISAGYAPRFSLGADDTQFLSYLVAVRNFLAHRSDGSRDRLRTVTTNLKGSNSNLAGTILRFDTYIKQPILGSSRVGEIVGRLKAIATALSQ